MAQLSCWVQEEQLNIFFVVFSGTDVANLLQEIGDGAAAEDVVAVQLEAVDHETIANLQRARSQPRYKSESGL